MPEEVSFAMELRIACYHNHNVFCSNWATHKEVCKTLKPGSAIVPNETPLNGKVGLTNLGNTWYVILSRVAPILIKPCLLLVPAS
jgi:hypothetical protein